MAASSSLVSTTTTEQNNTPEIQIQFTILHPQEPSYKKVVIAGDSVSKDDTSSSGS